jgi:beta-glucosidase
VNIYRAPMNGRNFEYFGEDPWLGSRIAVGYIRGVQEEKVSATVKHFLGNNSEFTRHSSDSIIDERTMREIYMPIFEAAVKDAHVGAVMSSYNLTNGEHMSANGYLARHVLKEQWGFDGVLMSDWGGAYDGVAQAKAALDLEMPTAAYMNRATLLPAVHNGTISAANITDSVRRQFRLADRFGWMNDAATDVSLPTNNIPGREAAYRGALEGAVLLRNAKDLLPLDASRLKTVAVIGPAAYPGAGTAGGSGHVSSFTQSSLLEGLTQKLGPNVSVTYNRGLPTYRVVNLLTRFTTDATSGKPGVSVETFATDALSGTPTSTRVEASFAMGAPGLVDPDFFAVLETLPPMESRALFGSLVRHDRKRTYERWTGWYSPSADGAHTITLQANGGYRLFIDDELAIDSARTPKAALRTIERTLTAKPHKVVLEQAGGIELGSGNALRVGIRASGTFVDPLAKQLAAKADAVIVAVGFDAETETEGADREFGLPPGQADLIREIAAVNPRTIVVVTAGGAVDMRPWIADAPAIVMNWYPGQEGGRALADLLLGTAGFSGRLPISWERAPEDNPTYASYYFNDPKNPNAIVYREGVFVGYRGYQKANLRPLFPFGFGLSYTSFKYSNFTVKPSTEPQGDVKTPLYAVSFDVTNTGKRAGADVAQVYVGAVRPRVPRPPRELKGFARTELKPGESQHVTVLLDARSFAYYDVGGQAWRADAGSYRIELGQSSDDIAASTELKLPKNLTER